MKSFYFSILLLCINPLTINAQPGPFGTDISLTLTDENDNALLIQNTDLDIQWIYKKWVYDNDSDKGMYIPDSLKTIEAWQVERGSKYSLGLYKNDSCIIVNTTKTPAGGGIRDGEHFYITLNKDTMRIYPPVGYFRELVELRLSFLKGDYVITPHDYLMNRYIKPDKRHLIYPNLKTHLPSFGKENVYTYPMYGTYMEECPEERIEEKWGNNTSDPNKKWFIDDFLTEDATHDYHMRSFIWADWKIGKIGFFPLSEMFVYQPKDNGLLYYGYIRIHPKTKEKNKEYSALYIDKFLDDEMVLAHYYELIITPDNQFKQDKKVSGKFKLYVDSLPNPE